MTVVSGQSRIAMKRSLGESRADHFRRMVRVMRTSMRPPRVWAWGAVAALTIGLVGIAGPASAAPPAANSAPVATATAATPVDDTVTVSYSINRAAKQIAQPVSCTLDTFAVDCGAQISTSKKLTTYSLNLTGLADGFHTFAVTFTLTDGGTATASTEFTITPPASAYAQWETACSGLNGFSAAGGSTWSCFSPRGGLSDVTAPLKPICDEAPGFFDVRDPSNIDAFCLGIEG